MQRIIMKSKIHGATIIEANVNYEGSLTIDRNLMEKSDIIEGERVQIVNLDNGERIETYTITGERGTGIIATNGPAALKCLKGHRIHIISYAMVNHDEIMKETILFLDDKNRIKKIFKKP